MWNIIVWVFSPESVTNSNVFWVSSIGCFSKTVLLWIKKFIRLLYSLTKDTRISSEIFWQPSISWPHISCILSPQVSILFLTFFFFFLSTFILQRINWKFQQQEVVWDQTCHHLRFPLWFTTGWWSDREQSSQLLHKIRNNHIASGSHSMPCIPTN